MTKRKGDELGFDLGKAIKRVHRAALAAGALPKNHPLARSPFATAEAHQHGIGPGGCKIHPCRLAGLCLALAELVQHQREAEELKSVLEAARHTEQVRKWLRSSGHEYVGALAKLMKCGELLHTPKSKVSVTVSTHDHALLCVRPVDIVQHITAFLAALGTFDDDLLKIPWSRQLQQPGDRKGGGLLLTAVWQHLDWGGLTYDEIFELVPSFGTPANVKNTVRDRVRKGRRKARSHWPRELHPNLPKPPKVEKHLRRRSST
jgi:hypothetical protein